LHVASEAGSQPSFFPFCSQRCKAVDLGNWVTESYRIEEPALDEDLDPLDEDGARPRGRALADEDEDDDV
jgi:endogenous inhibitor of DNA gyrase (YacG/DUF329 family)